MFRKAVSTLEGVKAGKSNLRILYPRLTIRRRVQLSTTIQHRGRAIHVANELHSESEMVSYIVIITSHREATDCQVP